MKGFVSLSQYPNAVSVPFHLKINAVRLELVLGIVLFVIVIKFTLCVWLLGEILKDVIVSK